MLIVPCAVCEREIEEQTALLVDVAGRRYPVCSEQCRRELLRDPESYAEEGAFEQVF